MDPAGKVAVISGGASGPGAATAGALLDAGAAVVVLDRALAAVRAGLHWQQCDVTGAASTGGAVNTVSERFGDIRIGVNCAGIGGLGSIAASVCPQDLDDFRRVIEVNLLLQSVEYPKRAGDPVEFARLACVHRYQLDVERRDHTPRWRQAPVCPDALDGAVSPQARKER